MKQSLIITFVICLFVGESFSIINKREHRQKNENVYCCNKVCGNVKDEKKAKDAQQADSYLPMLNMLYSNL
jgi:hypothetical protein